MTWQRRLLVPLLSLLLGGFLFVGALKQRNYVYPELSCPQNPQPIPWSETGMRALQPTLSTLEITLQKFMATYDIPGMSAGVVYDQTPIWARGFGVTNVSSPSGNIPTPDTIFRIGSISKAFVGLMLFQLRDKGLLHLDEEVSKKFPDLEWHNAFPTKRGITYGQLASHMAGLPRFSPCSSAAGSCQFSNEEMMERIANTLAIQPTDAMPAYSNLGIALLAHLLEQIAQIPYATYVEENILKPLGMLNTGFVYTPAVIKRLAVGYLADSRVEAPLYDLGWDAPTGQMYSTINDLAKLHSLLFRDNITAGSTQAQILDGQTIKEWLLPIWVTANSPEVMVYLGRPWECYLLTGAGTISNYWLKGKGGDISGYTAEILTAPDAKLGVSVLMNTGPEGPSFAIASTMLAQLLPAFEKIFKEFREPPPLPPRPELYVGNYTATLEVNPFFISNVTGNLSLITGDDGFQRLHLLISESYLGTPKVIGSYDLRWIPALQTFQIIVPACPTSLAGGNQLIFFNSDHTSFTIPGLLYGYVWAK